MNTTVILAIKNLRTSVKQDIHSLFRQSTLDIDALFAKAKADYREILRQGLNQSDLQLGKSAAYRALFMSGVEISRRFGPEEMRSAPKRFFPNEPFMQRQATIMLMRFWAGLPGYEVKEPDPLDRGAPLACSVRSSAQH